MLLLELFSKMIIYMCTKKNRIHNKVDNILWPCAGGNHNKCTCISVFVHCTFLFYGAVGSLVERSTFN